jgi:hypothetical protein
MASSCCALCWYLPSMTSSIPLHSAGSASRNVLLLQEHVGCITGLDTGNWPVLRGALQTGSPTLHTLLA